MRDSTMGRMETWPTNMPCPWAYFDDVGGDEARRPRIGGADTEAWCALDSVATPHLRRFVI